MPASQPHDSRATNYWEELVVASAARTATTVSDLGNGYGPTKTIRAQLNVSAASGTSPTLNVTIEDSLDNGTTWNVIGTFAQKTATSREVINVTAPFGDRVRINAVIAGTTPSFTYDVRLATEVDPT